ncbi:class I SAM-dependent methyltransferase [Piscinibacter sp. XHJ-5]|uniref:class I SAM-dependent methyltransferase n=1 Tax=Piscinibacter sp. XHJ-5 TaxID=3037797 RepID=UPI002452E2D3|nr:class I SAM-dependent methyltransferase [Piscinibacter sp. XHJ-5]
MKTALRRYLGSQQFNPGLLGAFLNPFFLARRVLWREIAAAGRELHGPLLDVGCGTKPYRTLFATDSYVGLDIDSETARLRGIADAYYDGHRFPFQNSQFRAVLCNQVLEHVFNPAEFVGEIHRVLDRGGRLLLTVPFVWDEHEQPYDYARYSSFGLKALLEQHGFRVLSHRKLLADASMLFQLVNAYLFKVTRTRFTSVNLLVTAGLLGPLSLLGLVLGAVLPKNPDLFLDQLVVAERL